MGLENGKGSPMRTSKADRIKGRPPVVHRAVLRNDAETLSHYGKKGAEASAKAKLERKANAQAEDAFYREREIARADAETARRAEENREHITPLEPDEENGDGDETSS